RVWPNRPPLGARASTFSRIAPRAASSVSTNRQKTAPRDRASSPSAPEPANRSITRASRTPGDQGACSRMLNTAWRARSEVGRVASPSGVRRILPRWLPDVIRMRLGDQLRGVRGLGGPRRTGGLAEVGREEGGRADAGRGGAGRAEAGRGTAARAAAAAASAGLF